MPTIIRISPIVWRLNPVVVTDTAKRRIAPTAITTMLVEKAHPSSLCAIGAALAVLSVVKSGWMLRVISASIRRVTWRVRSNAATRRVACARWAVSVRSWRASWSSARTGGSPAARSTISTVFKAPVSASRRSTCESPRTRTSRRPRGEPHDSSRRSR